uniref:Uncharacterized protein n=1 Tax=Oryza meridionalis TaxID=40149 RepID=A0A0E0D2Z3_9ORYZ
MKHRRGPRALTTDRLDHQRGRTNLLNHQKTPRPGMEANDQEKGGASRRGGGLADLKGNCELKARTSKTSVSSMLPVRVSGLRGANPTTYNCGNPLQLHHQRRDRSSRASSRAAEKKEGMGGWDAERRQREGKKGKEGEKRVLPANEVAGVADASRVPASAPARARHRRNGHHRFAPPHFAAAGARSNDSGAGARSSDGSAGCRRLGVRRRPASTSTQSHAAAVSAGHSALLTRFRSLLS